MAGFHCGFGIHPIGGDRFFRDRLCNVALKQSCFSLAAAEAVAGEGDGFAAIGRVFPRVPDHVAEGIVAELLFAESQGGDEVGGIFQSGDGVDALAFIVLVDDGLEAARLEPARLVLEPFDRSVATGRRFSVLVGCDGGPISVHRKTSFSSALPDATSDRENTKLAGGPVKTGYATVPGRGWVNCVFLQSLIPSYEHARMHRR